MPSPGPGATWFQIDILKFDQQFLAILSLISSLLTLAGMIILRPLMAQKQIVYIVGTVGPSPVRSCLSPISVSITASTNGRRPGPAGWSMPDSLRSSTRRWSPLLGQIAMIPMLAWIAKNAPSNLKATFFAVMASFTNLALSASSLMTKYLNQIFVVTREVKDQATGAVQTGADYSQLGMLLVTVVVAALIVTSSDDLHRPSVRRCIRKTENLALFPRFQI